MRCVAFSDHVPATFLELVRESWPGCPDEQRASDIVWEFTGWPCFWPSEFRRVKNYVVVRYQLWEGALEHHARHLLPRGKR